METASEEEMMATEEPDMAMESGEHSEMDAMETDGDDAMGDSGEGDMMEDAQSDEMMDESVPDQSIVETPTWFSAALTNVNQEATFTINDYRGKVVLVETMAIWCSNCLSQQKQVRELHNLIGEQDDFISVGLDIDPNENAVDLAGYTDRNGFDWVYAVAPPEVSREIGQIYGSQFLNPPSTPILIIDRHGEAHPLPFGIKSAADLRAAVEPFLKEGM
jgi:thiol-disulfide isomerase/thioredoxin